MGYLGLENNIGVNVKHGKLEIELAVERWYFATNAHNDPTSIEKALIFAGRDDGLETRIESAAYDAYGRAMDDNVAVYHRGEGTELTVPLEVVNEARKYLLKSEAGKRDFLYNFYAQVVFGSAGSYSRRFREGKPEIARGLVEELDRVHVVYLFTYLSCVADF